MILPLITNLSAGLLGTDIINLNSFLELLIRFVFNTVIVLTIVRYIYYPLTHKRDYLFTFILISTVIFLMCFLLESVKLQLGFALGLFAVFGIIRYRTTTISIKEMTYLFIVIGISVINALSNKEISYVELIFTNVVLVVTTFLTERIKGLENESSIVVMYEKIELATPQRKNELITDLEKRMGIKISRIEFSNFDYQRDVVKIYVFFYKSRQSWADDTTLEYRSISNE